MEVFSRSKNRKGLVLRPVSKPAQARPKSELEYKEVGRYYTRMFSFPTSSVGTLSPSVCEALFDGYDEESRDVFKAVSESVETGKAPCLPFSKQAAATLLELCESVKDTGTQLKYRGVDSDDREWRVYLNRV